MSRYIDNMGIERDNVPTFTRKELKLLYYAVRLVSVTREKTLDKETLDKYDDLARKLRDTTG